VPKPEELNIFTELLNRLHKNGFKITKVAYNVLNEDSTDFEVHATYNDGVASWFFAFSCRDGVCKVREEDVGMEVVLKALSVDAFINNAFNIITSLKNAQKDIRFLAEKIRQALGAGARLDDLKTEVVLNKYYGKSLLNEGFMQIMLLPRKVKINIEVSLTNWDKIKLLSLVAQLDDALQRQMP